MIDDPREQAPLARRWMLVAISALALTVPIAPTMGTVVTIAFSGTLDFIEPGLPFSQSIGLGTPFTGFYSYDSGVPDSSPNADLGTYLFPDRVMHAAIGPLSFMTPDLGVGIDTHPVVHRYIAGNLSTFSAYGIDWRTMAVSLTDASATAFDTDALPLGPPDLDNFAYSRLFYLVEVGHRYPSIQGTIETLTLVPEPTTLVSLLGAATLVALRRRG